MNKKSLIALLLFVSLVPVQVFAGCEGPIVPCSGGDCNLCHIFELINNILSLVLTCVVPIVGAIMLVWGGFYFLISGAKPDDVKKAQGIIWAVVIGIVIIFIAWVFLNTFLSSIGVAEWTGLENWWDIKCGD